jgi:hypothetical protein
MTKAKGICPPRLAARTPNEVLASAGSRSPEPVFGMRVNPCQSSPASLRERAREHARQSLHVMAVDLRHVLAMTCPLRLEWACSLQGVNCEQHHTSRLWVGIQEFAADLNQPRLH